MKLMTPHEALERAQDYGWNQDLEDIVVDSGEPNWAYMFAALIEGANIKRLEQVVINSNDPFWAFRFALQFPDSDIRTLQQVVIDSGNVTQAYLFARNIPGANISDIVDYVLVKEPEHIKDLFDMRPDLKREYELGEIRKQIRTIIRNVLQ